MDHSQVRPSFPGTTPAPGPMGLRNVYASKLPPQVPTEHTSHPQFHAPTSNNNNQRALLEKTVNKIVSKLPFQLRESVTAVITMAMTSAENVQKDLDICYHEIAALRNDLGKKSSEAKILKKSCSLYEERIRSLEENVEVLKDNIDARQKFSIKNKSAMTRLSSTNRMLIDALDALQSSSGNNGTGVLLMSKSQGNLDIEDRDRPGLLVPISKNKATKDTQHHEYEETEKKVSMFQNDKLRESLLRVAREHYRSMKNSELLDAKVIELRASLRAQEQQNRKLKSELDEVRILLNADGANANTDVAPPTDTANTRTYQFGALDTRFKGLIDRNAFDPIDGIQLLRRLLAHSATAPSNLNLHSTLLHIASRETLKIFECDMVCLFIKDPVRDNILLRYTVKAPIPEEINTNDTTCVAAEVIKSSKIARINVVANHPSFNPMVDCCTGVIVKRMMSLPIYDADTNRVFGCVTLVNKSQNDLFSEIDEIFGLLYADQASLLITACMRYDGMALHATMLQHLLQASTSVFSVIPDPDSLVSTRPLEPAQILTTLETISREILKCPSTRAFLVSEFAGLPPGELVLLEHVGKSKALEFSNIITMPLRSGIAGHVIETRMMYKLENDKFDPYLNPLVDIDPLDAPLITVPIVDLHNTVVGCLQLVVGPRSPKLRESEDAKSQQGLLFVQAAQWLTHQIAAPLQYLIKYIGNTVNRPVSTPSNLPSRGPKPDFFMSGLENMAQSASFRIESSYRASASSSPTATGDFLVLPFDRASSAQSRVKFAEDGKASDELQAERDALQHELSESRNEVMELYSKLSEAEALASKAAESRDDFMRKVAEMEAEIAVLKQTVAEKAANDHAIAALDHALASQAAADAEAAQARQEMETLRAGHDGLAAELAESRDQVAALMVQIENLEAYAAAHHKDPSEEPVESAAPASEPAESAEGAAGEAPPAGDADEKTRLACEAVREAVTAEWKESYDSLEQSYNSYKVYYETLQAEHEELKVNASSIQAALDTLMQESAAAQEQKGAAEAENADLKEKIAALTATIAQKDSVQAILQAQVVRMAGQNIKDIDMAISNATAPPAASVPAPQAAMAADPPVQVDAPTISVASNGPPRPGMAAPASGRPRSRPPSGLRPSRPSSGARAASAGDPTPTAAVTSGGDSVPEAVWTELVDEYQRTYYYNEATGESSWSNPALGEVRRGDWLQTYDESGVMYWVHQLTGESAWDVTAEGEPVDSTGADLEEDDGSAHNSASKSPGIYDTVNSQYSATAGDYTIEL